VVQQERDGMTKLRTSLFICATICTILVLALFVSVATYGAGLQQYSHGPLPPPDDDRGPGEFAHGPLPPPDDDRGPGELAHGPLPPPDDDRGPGELA
jgi:hypothetical protein